MYSVRKSKQWTDTKWLIRERILHFSIVYMHDLDKNDVKFKNRSIFEKVRENAKPVRDPLFRLITKHNLK